MTSNINGYLRVAKDLFQGDLANNNEALKEARDAKNGTLYTILCNLICHASVVVFANDYSRAKAKRFKEDVVASFGISEKQAGKWTESISAALGVRGVRKGVKGIQGLGIAANDGVKSVGEFLKAKEIETFNQFIAATKTPANELEALAKSLHKLSDEQRARVKARLAELDKADEEDAPAEQAPAQADAPADTQEEQAAA